MSEAIERSGKRDLRSMIEGESFKAQIAKVLPKHVTPDRFVRVAITAMIKTPKLLECTQESVIDSLLALSQAGLEPDGRRAHLVPYYNGKKKVYECKFIIDYKGYVEMAIKSGYVSNVHAQEVCENDDFLFNLGNVERHIIDFKKPRGKIYLYYTAFRMKDGSVKYEVMTVEEIEKIRQRSPAGECGPWKTDAGEMMKKTPTRRGSKWVPMSPEYRDVIEKDFDNFDPIEFNPKANVIPPPMKHEEPIDVTPEPEPEPERAPEPEEPEYTPVQPGETEPPDDVHLASDDEPPAVREYDENTAEGLKNKIRDKAAGHFPNPPSFNLWLKTLTRNEEKGYRGFDSIDEMRSFKQLQFVYGALKRKMGEK